MTKAEQPQVNQALPDDEFAKKNEDAAALALPAAAPPAEADDIPEEVKKQLIGYEEIELERLLYDCMASFGTRQVTVDKIILCLWARHKKTADRNKLIRMLNVMALTGLLVKHHSPRGYSMPPLNTPEAE